MTSAACATRGWSSSGCPGEGDIMMINHGSVAYPPDWPNLGFINWKLLLKNSKDKFLQLFSALNMIRILICQLEVAHVEDLFKLQQPRF